MLENLCLLVYYALSKICIFNIYYLTVFSNSNYWSILVYSKVVKCTSAFSNQEHFTLLFILFSPKLHKNKNIQEVIISSHIQRTLPKQSRYISKSETDTQCLSTKGMQSTIHLQCFPFVFSPLHLRQTL